MTDPEYDGSAPLDSARHERFAQNIVKGMAAGPAYTAAGYRVTGNSAKSAGGRLLTNVDVQARIAWLQGQAADRAEVTAERTLREMACMAYYDATDILDMSDDGKTFTIRNPKSLPEDLRRAIVEITQVQVGDETRYRVKLADKAKALDMLGRHLQMFKDIVRIENVFEVVKAMDDDALDRRLAELERSLEEAITLGPEAGKSSSSIH